MILARADSVDLVGAHESVASGRNSASGLLAHALQAADSPACANAFIRRFDSSARASAAAVDELQRHGAPLPPLAGLAVSIKDLFDIAGQPSTGGSASMHDAPAARDDSPAVARLRAAGAALIGHTNLSEFAFSASASTRTMARRSRWHRWRWTRSARPRWVDPGGATTVAAGAAWAALGSDTGGSIRIPAALQGLVGFKNTQRLTPLDGCIPLSSTLDTSCMLTRTVRDAVLLHDSGCAARDCASARCGCCPAVPTAVMLNDLERRGDSLRRRVAVLRDSGAVIGEIDCRRRWPRPRWLCRAESWPAQAASDRLGEQYDRVAARIRRGQAIGAADYIDLLQARAAWIADVDDTIAGYDALLSPTVPMHAPPVAPLQASDDAFIATNARLLRNPSVVNFFDGCALSLPCHAAGQLPVGLMVWGTALSDDAVLSTSLTIESALASTGITKA
jgi:Asp-tRNA(Asn)/Glu-tRNA(Gln) amidotransferase A subunit family amidase